MSSILLNSCIYDDRSKCPSEGTNFLFSYKYAQKGQNEFPTPVKGVRLYIFNKDSLFLDMVRTDLPQGTEKSTFTMNHNLPNGTYNIVALAGEKNESIYHYVKDVNGSYQTINFVKGKTKLQDVLFLLGDNPKTTNKLKSDIYNSDNFLNLYHCLVTDVQINTKDIQVPISLTKITHDIIVTVNDNRTKPDIDQFDLRGSLFNNAMDFGRQIYSNASKVRYYSYQTKATEPQQKVFRLSSMRLTPDMLGDLVLTDHQTGTEYLRQALVKDILMQHSHFKPKQGESPDQEKLDKQSSFNIELDISDGMDVTIYVTVNDWKEQIINTDI